LGFLYLPLLSQYDVPTAKLITNEKIITAIKIKKKKRIHHYIKHSMQIHSLPVRDGSTKLPTKRRVRKEKFPNLRIIQYTHRKHC
jgi:hypothetical protein